MHFQDLYLAPISVSFIVHLNSVQITSKNYRASENKRPFATHMFHIQFQMLTELEVPKPCPKIKNVHSGLASMLKICKTVSENILQTADVAKIMGSLRTNFLRISFP